MTKFHRRARRFVEEIFPMIITDPTQYSGLGQIPEAAAYSMIDNTLDILAGNNSHNIIGVKNPDINLSANLLVQMILDPELEEKYQDRILNGLENELRNRYDGSIALAEAAIPYLGTEFEGKVLGALAKVNTPLVLTYMINKLSSQPETLERVCEGIGLYAMEIPLAVAVRERVDKLKY